MSRKRDRLNDLRFADLTTFLTVRRCGSITGAARELKVTPSQVSKAIVRLEAQFKTTLLSRGARGVSISDDGMRMAPQFSDLVERLSQIRRTGDEPEITLAAASFLVSQFVPPICERLPRVRVRSLEMPPALVRSHAAENFFDMAITLGPARLPSLWTSVRVGDVRKALFARPEIARKIGKGPVTQDKLREYPFVSPIYNVDKSFVPVDDDCPLPRAERKLGHEVHTLHVALEVATRCDQLVFGPALAAKRHLESGRLVEVRVDGWDVKDALHVSSNVDRVLASTQKAIAEIVRTELAKV
jgi:DNA-binding transcriptional LysR family regulator